MKKTALLLTVMLMLVSMTSYAKCKIGLTDKKLGDYSTVCQTDTSKPEFKVRFEGKDTLVCFSMSQFRKIDYWLDDRTWLQGQYELQKQAIAKCSELQEAQINLSHTLQKDRDYWKKTARRKNGIIIGGGVALATVAGLMIWLATK